MHEQLFLFPEIEPQIQKRQTTEEKYGNYAAFVDKFKGKKTTDDCYTPPAVMEVVNDYVRNLPNVGDRPFVRPFYPGGDYQAFDYPDNCVVVDNPPFSIYSKIVRWYLKNGIDFFLFAPSLTMCVRGVDVCYVVASAAVLYENGATVNTSFTTNLLHGVRFRLDKHLRDEIERAKVKPTKNLRQNNYDDHVVSPALLLKYARGCFDIAASEIAEVGDLDVLKDSGRPFFGTPWLVSDSVVERMRIERERIERERIPLSPRELEIINQLNQH